MNEKNNLIKEYITEEKCTYMSMIYRRRFFGKKFNGGVL